MAEVDDLIVCTLGILMCYTTRYPQVLYKNSTDTDKYSNRTILPCASQFSHKCNIFSLELHYYL